MTATVTAVVVVGLLVNSPRASAGICQSLLSVISTASPSQKLLLNPVNPTVPALSYHPALPSRLRKKGITDFSDVSKYTYFNSSLKYLRYNESFRWTLHQELFSTVYIEKGNRAAKSRKPSFIQWNRITNPDLMALLSDAGFSPLHSITMDDIVIAYRKKKLKEVQLGKITAEEVIEPSLTVNFPDGSWASVTYGQAIPDSAKVQSVVIDNEDFLKNLAEGRMVIGSTAPIRVATHSGDHIQSRTYMHDLYHLAEMHQNPAYGASVTKKSKEIVARDMKNYRGHGYLVALEMLATLDWRKRADILRLLSFPGTNAFISVNEVLKNYEKSSLQELRIRAKKILESETWLEYQAGAVAKDPRTRLGPKADVTPVEEVLEKLKQSLKNESNTYEQDFELTLARTETFLHNGSLLNPADWVDHLMGDTKKLKETALYQALCESGALSPTENMSFKNIRTFWYWSLCQ